MLNIIKVAVREIKELHLLAKQTSIVLHKGKYMSLLYLNILFLIVYIIPILYSMVIIGGTFIYGPIVLLGLLFTIPFILFVLWIRLKAYPVMKKNYLEKSGMSQ
ncbi:hypothetical protein [Mesobacillus jeotgali]|uniref:Uncharacterized protein n=1 Tax=Mesobacillus jeotgali TaxID=129985 RepID=A0ABY9VFP4_9BACI|nr:hypothetical protein [Mesobacillus jeotgali]WNF22744.1 hypothetical protein RH061_21750 [Mesobacillus jeotgali]